METILTSSLRDRRKDSAAHASIWACRSGWAVAAALGVAWTLRRRGDFEVWKGGAHLYSNRSLDDAFRLGTQLWSGSPDDKIGIVVRRGGARLATIDHADYAATVPHGRSCSALTCRHPACECP